MKIFIIGENHDKDYTRRRKLIKNIDYGKTFLSIEPYIYPVVKKEHNGIKNITLYGIEDYVIRLYSDIINIYALSKIKSEKLLADTLQTLIYEFNDLSMMHDRPEYSDGFTYYKKTYGENFFDEVKSVKEKLMLFLIGESNPDYNSIPEKKITLGPLGFVKNELGRNVLVNIEYQTLEIMKKISDILENSQIINSLPKKYIGNEFINQLANSTRDEARRLAVESSLYIRDKPFSQNTERYIKNIEFIEKDVFIFIVGARHLFGLSQELSEKHLPVKISYCFGYKDFNRQYRKHKDEITRLDMRNKWKQAQKIVTHFFKPQIEEQPIEKESLEAELKFRPSI